MLVIVRQGKLDGILLHFLGFCGMTPENVWPRKPAHSGNLKDIAADRPLGVKFMNNMSSISTFLRIPSRHLLTALPLSLLPVCFCGGRRGVSADPTPGRTRYCLENFDSVQFLLALSQKILKETHSLFDRETLAVSDGSYRVYPLSVFLIQIKNIEIEIDGETVLHPFIRAFYLLLGGR
jgi:hypothetical protein